MSGLFNMLAVGKNGLMAQQAALSVINHNIANASTPGYSRQRIQLGTLSVIGGIFNPHGNGVAIEGIERITDSFLTNQLGRARGDMGLNAAQSRVFDGVEILFGEPADTNMGDKGLGGSIADFLNGWQPVINPEMEVSEADLRGLIIENARSLSNRFRSLTKGLDDQADSLRLEIQGKVTEVNDLADAVAELNLQLFSRSLSDTARNDLEDRRALHAQRLAELTGADWETNDMGTLRVYLGGRVLVDHATVHGIELIADGAADDTMRGYTLVPEDGRYEASLSGGELKGLLGMLNDELPTVRGSLDTLAQRLIERVNDIHQNASGAAGGGIDFFVGDSASTIAVNPVFATNPELISLSGTLPDGREIAEAMFDLHTTPLAEENGLTLEGIYAAMIGRVGGRSANVRSLAMASSNHIMGIEQKLASTAGVNIDEEIANMMAVQASFEAASKVIGMVDELMQTILTMV